MRGQKLDIMAALSLPRKIYTSVLACPRGAVTLKSRRPRHVRCPVIEGMNKARKLLLMREVVNTKPDMVFIRIRRNKEIGRIVALNQVYGNDISGNNGL
jgi:hypothetical protein